MIRRFQAIFTQRSDAFTKRLKSSERVTIDVLVLGSGVHGSITAANLYRQDPFRKYLVLSASQPDGAVFNVGDLFRVNSAGGSANVFPGSVIQLRDVMTEKYSVAQRFSDLTTANLASFEGEFAFGQWATGISERPLGAKLSEWPTRYRVETSEGLLIDAENIVLAPGFGKPRYPFKDADFVKLIREEEIKPQPKLQSGDDLLDRANRRLEAGEDPLDTISVEEVFVVGDGHGGNIIVEFFRRLAPKTAYGKNPGKPKRVVWIGQKAKNGAEFKQKYREEFDAPKWDRYDPLGDELDGGGIESVPARLNGGKKIVLPDGTEAYELQLLHPDGSITKRIARSVVFTTGYESMLGDFLKTLDSEFELRNVVGHIESDIILGETAIGKQVFTGAGKRAQNIFVSGPPAVPLATPAEVAVSTTHNPVSIDVLGRRTQALAKRLSPPTRRASRLMPAPTDTGAFVTEVIAPKIDLGIPSDFRTSAFESEVHLIRSCARFSLPKQFQVSFRWRGERGPKGRLAIEVHGLDTPSARRFTRVLGRNEFLLRSLAQAFQDDLNSAIRFEITADEFGRALDTTFLKTP
jgi:hypothetical protein